nr:MAG TPA: hypothetical protein [Caudoviricetes sp.]
MLICFQVNTFTCLQIKKSQKSFKIASSFFACPSFWFSVLFPVFRILPSTSLLSLPFTACSLVYPSCVYKNIIFVYM